MCIAALLLAVQIVAAVPAAGPAQARPMVPVPADLSGGGPGVTLDWPALGLPPSVDFPAANVAQVFTVPIPLGLNAVRFRGVIRGLVNFGPGFLEVDDDQGTQLAAVPLPSAATDPAATPFDVDIAAARRLASSTALSLTVRQLDPAGQICGPVTSLTISNMAVDFAGDAPPPDTIATFFAPVLQAITIYAPTDADLAEQQAALTLVTTLTWLYQPQPVDISVVSQPRGATPTPAAPVARVIVVERGDAGLSITNPGRPDAYLRVSGVGDQLSAQVSLLDNQLQTLAQADSATVLQTEPDVAPSGDVLTFEQLKMKGKVDVLRSATMAVGVDRAALGAGRADTAQLHLRADYTPVAKNAAAAMVVRSNDAVLYRAALNDTGVVDASFDVPPQVLAAQRVTLNFALTYTPDLPCGPTIAPMTFELDPASAFTIERGGPAPGGFQSLPSEFTPNFLVALDGTSPRQLGYAASIVRDVARMTTTRLTPRSADVDDAASSNSGALILANWTTLQKVSLKPLLSGEGAKIEADVPQKFRGELAGNVGSIQAFADPTRDRTVLLVTTTGSWDLVDPLFTYLLGLGNGWGGLTGDLLAAGASGTPSNIAIRTGGADPAPPSASASPWRNVAIGIGAAAVVVIALLVAALWWRHRSRPANPT